MNSMSDDEVVLAVSKHGCFPGAEPRDYAGRSYRDMPEELKWEQYRYWLSEHPVERAQLIDLGIIAPTLEPINEAALQEFWASWRADELNGGRHYGGGEDGR